EQGLFDLCAAMNIAFVAYSPLGNGFLSGRFTRDTVYGEGGFRGFMGRFRPEVMERNQALLELIRDMAESRQAPPAQIVLAWELAQRPFIIPIPGTTNPARLEENLGAARIELSPEELAAINVALAQLSVDETYF
uniref:aldo/keto reductase n=1 Tax=uncultured Bilophila sp. TaxID=529385 RepID=UPI00280B68DA